MDDDRVFPNDQTYGKCFGLSKREYFAIKILVSVLDQDWPNTEMARDKLLSHATAVSVKLADSLIEELGKPNG